MTLMDKLLEAGYPREQMFGNYSDLYVFVMPLTKRVISEWHKEHGAFSVWPVPVFRDLVTGCKMFNCAFAFDPYWEEKCSAELIAE